MRAAGVRKRWSRHCGRSPRNSAAGSRRMPAGIVSNSHFDSTARDATDMTDTQAVHAQQVTCEEPQGDLCIRTLAMPADTNANGDIFGGWLMAQMDLAGGSAAVRRARGRVATVAVDSMTFHRPVKVGDEVSLYARVLGVGRSSIRV